MEKGIVLKKVRAALEYERRINLHRCSIHMDFHEGVLTLEGEVENIAAKRLSRALASRISGVRAVVDRLRVTPAEHMADDAILDAVRNAVLQEPVFAECALHLKSKGRVEVIREPPFQPGGVIEIAVAEGVVALEGQVINLTLKRLAGVLAWWVPGARDVENGLKVVPAEEDNDDEIADAVRIAFEKDPFLNPDQIHVSTRNCVVTLEGLVRNEAQKQMAENDAWFVLGVNDVVNRLEVRPW